MRDSYDTGNKIVENIHKIVILPSSASLGQIYFIAYAVNHSS